MDKPGLKEFPPTLDWSECQDWINEKYKIHIRDYAGKWHRKEGEEYDDSVPYQDFWHSIIHVYPHICNGCFFIMDIDDFEQSWEKEIAKLFFKEFSEYIVHDDVVDGEFLHFWTEW